MVSVTSTKNSWLSRLLVAIPFAIAALFNALWSGSSPIHLNYIARYGFLYSWPWNWLPNVGDLMNRLNLHNQSLESLGWYIALFWIPAVLYSVCIWLLLVVFRIAARRLLKRFDPDKVNTLKRRAAIASSIIVMAGLGWLALKLGRAQIACTRRGAAYALRIKSIEHDANQELSIGTSSVDVSQFFAEHGIPMDVVESEATGTIYTEGCGPVGCGTDRALIGVRVRLDSAGVVTEKPVVVGIYTDCL
jgi:hypothetical protein